MATGNIWNFTIPQEKENDIRRPLTSRQKQLDLYRVILFFSFSSFLLMGYKCIWRGGKKGLTRGKRLCIYTHTHRSYIQPWIKYVYTHIEAGNGSIYSFIRTPTHPFNPAGAGEGGDVAYPI